MLSTSYLIHNKKIELKEFDSHHLKVSTESVQQLMINNGGIQFTWHIKQAVITEPAFSVIFPKSNSPDMQAN